MPSKPIRGQAPAIRVLKNLDNQITKYFNAKGKADGNVVRVMGDVQDFIRAAKEEISDIGF